MVPSYVVPKEISLSTDERFRLTIFLHLSRNGRER